VKKDTTHIIRRAEHFKTILTAEGFLVGIIAGLVVLLYRVLLEYAGKAMTEVLQYAREYPAAAAAWLFLLVVMACIVGKLVKWEPMISGSGIPQVEGEILGKLNQNWKRVLPAKFLGGFLCLLGGLSLGREGPSIQLGAMTGQGISRVLNRGKTEEKYIMTCGASAGLAAAFHAPLAGMMFSLEEIHKGFSVTILVSVMTASVTADYISSCIIGLDPVFQFRLEHVLPQNYYWLLIVLGIFLGVMGVLYNKGMLKAQELYKKWKWPDETKRLIIAFMAAGIMAVVMPSVLGSGGDLIVSLTEGEMILSAVLLTFVAKFLFSAVSFGSGAPGGIFFPLLILGALLGGAFSMVCVELIGIDPVYINNFVLLAMAGYFTAIVRAPITGIILLFEMSGSVSQMLSLAIVSVAAYITATLLKSEPIYDSLLGRLLEGKEKKNGGGAPGRQKMLSEFVIMSGSVLEGRMVMDIHWPGNCLLVAVERGGKELIPRGKTRLEAGDRLTVLTDERDAGYVHDKLENLCYTSI